MTTQEQMESNKRSVMAFYDLIINKKDFESASKYMGPRYKQHNPLVKDYPEGLKEFINFLKTNYPEAKSEIYESSQKETTSFCTFIRFGRRARIELSSRYLGSRTEKSTNTGM